MNLTNESYIIRMGTKNFTERYYRDRDGWVKVSVLKRGQAVILHCESTGGVNSGSRGALWLGR